ncbi:MAG: terminase small subunit [Lachnospira sp.]
MAKANNSPTNWSEGLTTEDKGNMLTVFDSFRRLPPVRKDDVPEINQRLDDYFKICSDNAIIPTVEGMTIALGVSRQSLWKWENTDYEAGAIINRAKATINAMLTSATIQGKVNPVYSIWLQKNNFQYSDTQTLQVENITDKKPLTAAELPKLGEWKATQSAKDLPRLEPENFTQDNQFMENTMENTKDNT